MEISQTGPVDKPAPPVRRRLQGTAASPIEPRPCGWCCLTIDRHKRVDTPEGPEFFCIDIDPEEIERLIYLRACDLVERWELADPRDRWRQTGEAPPPRTIEPAPTAAQPYRTPQSTIDTFWYVVGLCNPERLTAWLDDHPQDASFLLKLLESK
jgi:hypothetical protein